MGVWVVGVYSHIAPSPRPYCVTQSHPATSNPIPSPSSTYLDEHLGHVDGVGDGGNPVEVSRVGAGAVRRAVRQLSTTATAITAAAAAAPRGAPTGRGRRC